MTNTFKPLLILILIFLSIISFSELVFADQKGHPELSTYNLNKNMGESPVLIELFSSQSCVFCPAADSFFNDLLKSGKVIGLACHVDYYNKDIDDMGTSTCTKRQKKYMSQLAAGTHFTPQMIINGGISKIGYKFDDVIESIINYSKSETTNIDIKLNNKETNEFLFVINKIEIDQLSEYSLYLGLYKKPIDLIVKSGRNKDKAITYSNMVEKIEKIDDYNGNKKEVTITLDLREQDGGFVVFLQNDDTGNMLAIAQYKIK